MTNKPIPVLFFSEDLDFNLQSQDAIANWLLEISSLENKEIHSLNYIFCSDSYLLELNKKYLNHNYFTDIITFQGEGNGLEGDIFISIHRVQDNAKSLKISFENELHRVIAHGLLHLIGYKDKSEAELQVMRTKEDWCLSLRKF